MADLIERSLGAEIESRLDLAADRLGRFAFRDVGAEPYQAGAHLGDRCPPVSARRAGAARHPPWGCGPAAPAVAVIGRCGCPRTSPGGWPPGPARTPPPSRRHLHLL